MTAASAARRARRGAVASLGLAGALAACATPPPPLATFNFDRPSDTDVVCLDVLLTAAGRLPPRPAVLAALPATACQTDPMTNLPLRDLETDANGAVHGKRLFALVTQSQRGELAAVNLQLTLDNPLIDNDTRTPGYTFIRTGAVPSAVAVDPRGGVTYVANAGERSVSVIDNTRLLGAGPHMLTAGAVGGAFVSHATPTYPEDVAVVARAGRYYLYVTLPASSAVLVVDVTDPRAPGARTLVPLAAGPVVGADAGTDADAADAVGAGGDAASADAGLDVGDANATADGVASGGVARPFHLAVSATGVVFVSDENLPVVHVLEPAGDGLVPRAGVPVLDAGVGTRDLAVSPRLVAPVDGTSQFVYAVSRVDGSVIALDADTGRRIIANLVAGTRANCVAPFADPTGCVRIEPLVPSDRVPLIAPATAVAFVARGAVDSTDCATGVAPVACTAVNDPNLGARALRGLHAVVTLRTGQVQVLDVFDADRSCRTTETLPPAQPHAPRNAVAFTAPPVLASSPTLVVNGGTVTVGPEQPRIVASTPGVACEASNNFCVELPSAPAPTGGRVATALAVRDETWTLTYQGVLPGLAVGGGDVQVRGALPANQLALAAPGVGFCARGALAGDIVRIASVGPSVVDPGFDAGLRSAEDPACRASFCAEVFGTSSVPCNRDHDVVRAASGELVVRVRAPETRCGGGMAPTAERLRDAVACCYSESLRFEVRAGSSWVVVGSRTGHPHGVVAGPDGACAGTGAGRVTENVPYLGPNFSLQIASGCLQTGCDPRDAAARAPTPLGATYTFGVTGGLSPLVLDGGPLPVAARYSCSNQRLYVVDQARNSLIEFPLSPIDTTAGVRRFN